MAKKKLDPKLAGLRWCLHKTVYSAGKSAYDLVVGQDELRSRSGLQRVVDRKVELHRAVGGSIYSITRTLALGGAIAMGSNGLTFVLPPRRGRVHTLDVTYDPGLLWGDAIREAAPSTPLDGDVWKADEHYPSGSSGLVTERLILVNFNFPFKDTRIVFDWGSQYRLLAASARATLAILRGYQTLNDTLGYDSMAVVSPEECQFGCGRSLVCGLWFGSDRREARLHWFGGGDFGSCYWFTFVS